MSVTLIDRERTRQKVNSATARCGALDGVREEQAGLMLRVCAFILHSWLWLQLDLSCPCFALPQMRD